MTFSTPRKLYLIGLFFILGVIATSYYLQYVLIITPCPLCLLQRFTLILLAGLFLVGASIPFKRWGLCSLYVISNFFCGIGLLLSGRQIWIQNLPHSLAPDCGASLKYMLRILPINQVVQKVFAGSAECTRIDWRFLDLGLAEWSFLCFGGLFLLTTWGWYHHLRHADKTG